MYRILYGILYGALGILISCVILGCKDGKIAISHGDNNTSELNEKLENIDVSSYDGLEDIISNSSRIESKTKPIMLIFGVNNCKYCEALKQDMRNNKDLHAFIKDNFVTYYINTSYSKNHEVSYMQKVMNTDDLSRYYGVVGTPLILWLEPNGRKILKLDGYNAEYFNAMLHFVNNKSYGNETDDEKRMRMFIGQYTQGKLKS